MRERNLTRAGRLLGLSQPATSHALARLRHMLHDDLFIRSPEGMQPTPRAEQMAEPIRDALRVLRLTLEPEEFDVARSVRGFSIVVNNYAARAIVPTLARKVGESAPNVSLDIKPVGMADVLDQLDAGGADVALAQLVDGGERFKCVRVTDDDYVVILDKDHPAAQEPSLSIERFVEIPHVVITSSGDDTSFVDRALEDRGLRAQGGNPRAIPVHCPDAGWRGSSVDLATSFRQWSVSCVSFGGEGTAVPIATHYAVDDLASASGQPAGPALVARYDPGLRDGLIAPNAAGYSPLAYTHSRVGP